MAGKEDMETNEKMKCPVFSIEQDLCHPVSEGKGKTKTHPTLCQAFDIMILHRLGHSESELETGLA